MELTKAVTIKYSPFKLLSFMFIFALMVYAGYRSATGDMVESHGEFSIYMGWFTMLFCGFGGLTFLYLLIAGPKYVLKIDATGIEYRQLLKADIFLPWGDIQKIKVRTIRGTKAQVEFFLDPEEASKILKSRNSRVQRLNKNFGFGDIAVSSAGLSVSRKELFKMIVAFANEYGDQIVLENLE